MAAFLALLAFLQTAGVHFERVSVPGPNGVNLDAALVLPAGQARAPPIVALHGCGGPFPSRDGQWAALLAKAGHIVLLPDSFGSRGLVSQCAMKERGVTPAGLRRDDAIDAAQWLAARPATPPGGVALIGWSNGGSTCWRRRVWLPVCLPACSGDSRRSIPVARRRMRIRAGSRPRRC